MSRHGDSFGPAPLIALPEHAIRADLGQPRRRRRLVAPLPDLGLEPLEALELGQRIVVAVLGDVDERDAVRELERRVPEAFGPGRGSSAYTARTSSSFSSTLSGLTR